MTHTYKLVGKSANDDITPNVILRTSDGIYIPKSEANSDYQAYLLWVSEGNTPEEAD